jgi:1-hydroxycarotenoid 3,4-desaturase
MGEPRVVVVGAGVAGLVAAAELSAAGCAVRLIERAHHSGGKLATAELAGRPIDVGPTVMTMRWVFDELFEALSRRLGDYVRLEPAEVLARHAWPDGIRLDLFSDVGRSAEAIRQAFGSADARAYLRFAAHSQAIYETVERPFLRSQRPDLAHAFRHVRALGVGAFVRIDAFRSMASALQSTFASPHLRQLFGRYATYCGSSPYEAPATFNLIAHVERAGVHRVVGGMRALASALARLARDLGVTVMLGAHVDRVLVGAGAARGVELASGERLDAEAIVFCGDSNAIAASLLGPDVARAVPRTSPEARSLSAVTWAMVARCQGFPLLHHNLFFSVRGPAELRDSTRGVWPPPEPTVYVCAQDRGDAAQPLDGERLLLVVNAHATGGRRNEWTEEVKRRWERSAVSTLARCGLSLSPEAVQMTTPADFQERFPATEGALYGPRATGALSTLSRPGARTRLPGLYLAGGSVHPGPGVPMAALSGRLAAARVLEDLASTRRSSRAAISGTTSTG